MSKKPDLDGNKEQQAEEYENVPSSVIFEALQREGEYELSRGFWALSWSGVAAGLAISMSWICKGFLASMLPAFAGNVLGGTGRFARKSDG